MIIRFNDSIAIRLLSFFLNRNVNQLFKVSSSTSSLNYCKQNLQSFSNSSTRFLRVSSCVGGEVSRIEITFSLLSSDNLPDNFSPGKLACGKKLQNSSKLLFTFSPPFLVSSSGEHLIPVAQRFLQPLPLENLIKCIHTYPLYHFADINRFPENETKI